MKIQTGLTREEFRNELTELVCDGWNSVLNESHCTLEELWIRACKSNDEIFAIYTWKEFEPSWLNEARKYCNELILETLGDELFDQLLTIRNSTYLNMGESINEFAQNYMKTFKVENSYWIQPEIVEPIVRSYGNFIDLRVIKGVTKTELEFPFEFID